MSTVVSCLTWGEESPLPTVSAESFSGSAFRVAALDSDSPEVRSAGTWEGMTEGAPSSRKDDGSGMRYAFGNRPDVRKAEALRKRFRSWNGEGEGFHQAASQSARLELSRRARHQSITAGYRMFGCQEKSKGWSDRKFGRDSRYMIAFLQAVQDKCGQIRHVKNKKKTES